MKFFKNCLLLFIISFCSFETCFSQDITNAHEIFSYEKFIANIRSGNEMIYHLLRETSSNTCLEKDESWFVLDYTTINDMKNDMASYGYKFVRKHYGTDKYSKYYVFTNGYDYLDIEIRISDFTYRANGKKLGVYFKKRRKYS